MVRDGPRRTHGPDSTGWKTPKLSASVVLLCTLIVTTAAIGAVSGAATQQGLDRTTATLPATSPGPDHVDTRDAVARTDVPPPEAFGYSSREARGVRPVLVVLVEYADQRLGANHTPTFYSNRLANVSAYYTENSRGRFTWGSPRIVGPYTVTDDGGTDWDEGRRHCWWNESTTDDACDGRPDRSDREDRLTQLAVERALDDVDIETYDRNDNGRIDQAELAVVAYQAAPPPAVGGMVRNSCSAGTLRESGTTVCLNVAVLGEGASFATTAHELAHQLGTDDIYGVGSRMNTGFSLMGGTIPGTADVTSTFHLDPWHKIQLGWATPRVYSIDELQAEGTCRRLAALSSSGLLSDRDTQRPVILYDPDRYSATTETGEYYLLEYRNGVSYDRDVPWRGLITWYVRTEGGDLVYEDAVIHPAGESDLANSALVSQAVGDDVRVGDRIHAGPNGVLDTSIPVDGDGEPMDGTATDAMNFVVAPDALEQGAPANYTQRGLSAPWTEGDGPFELRWFDGEPIGLSIAADQNYRDFFVDLNTDHVRIDSATEVMDPDGQVTLTGHLGGRTTALGERRQVRVAGGGVDESLHTTLWRCDRIHATVLDGLPTGTYRLWLDDPSSHRSSEIHDLTVRTVVERGDWLGRYQGRLDGEPVGLTITPASEFTYALTLTEQPSGETYRATVDTTTRHSLEDLTLESEAGSTIELDQLTLHREEPAWLAGTYDSTGDRRGVAFTRDGYVAGYDDEAIRYGDDDPWVDQWTGRYEGRLDGREATLRITDPVPVTFGTVRPGEGYQFDIEVEDHEEDVTYRATGLVDTTTPGSEHELEVGRLEPVGSTDPAEDFRDVYLYLHTTDVGIVSGTARFGRTVPGEYGPTDEATVMQFAEPGPADIDPAIVTAVRGLDASDYPPFAGAVLGNERVNLELGDSTIGVTTDRAGEPVRISRVAHESPTLIVTVDDRTMTDIERSSDPETAIRDATLAGDIDYRATTLTGRLGVGAAKLGVGVYNVARQVQSRLPF